MAKKRAHEEHDNHERWVISFADMMTLLFALFVVLYALKDDESTIKSIVKHFAFAVEGSGRSKVDGDHVGGEAGGDLTDGFPMQNAQKGDLQLLLQEVLSNYDRVAGQSRVTRQLDDMVTFEASLESMYEWTRLMPRPEASVLLRDVVRTAAEYHSVVRLRILARDRLAGRRRGGLPVNSLTFCSERLQGLRESFERELGLPTGAIQIELRNLGYGAGAARNWQRDGRLQIAFTNDR